MNFIPTLSELTQQSLLLAIIHTDDGTIEEIAKATEDFVEMNMVVYENAQEEVQEQIFNKALVTLRNGIGRTISPENSGEMNDRLTTARNKIVDCMIVHLNKTR
jgi:hypothetical protein